MTQQQGGTSSGDAGGSGDQQQATWFDSFADIKGDQALATTAARYKSPAEVLKAVNAGWGDQWRERYVAELPEAERPDVLAALNRYATPKAAIDGLRAAQQRIRTGELAKPLPDGANEQEIAAYRKDRGIPEKPDGYLENLPNGLVLGEDDKPVFGSFAEVMHKMNADPKLVHASIEWYNKFAEEQEAKVAEGDLTAKQQVEDALRTKWGPDYRANVNAMQGYLDTLPAGVADMLRSARLDDGAALFNSPEFVEFFVGLAREFNPVLAVMGGDGRPLGKGIEDEIASIEKLMRENRPAYNRDEKLQARYRVLLDARIKQQERSGKAA